MPEILFICTANQIRSPLAQEIFKRLLAEHGQSTGWRVQSAGTWAVNAAPPINHAVTIGRELGVDITEHRSRPVDAELMASADLVLVMEQGHKEALQFEFPGTRQKIYLITEITGEAIDVEDPVGRSLEDFRVIGRQLQEMLTVSYEDIIVLAARTG